MLNTVRYPQGQSAFGGKTILLTIVLCILSVQISQAQWQTDVRLTNNSEASNTSVNNAWCIAANENYVHAVWFDFRDGNGEIYYKRSTNEGVNWGAQIRLTNDANSSKYPSVAVSGSVVHVVWYDERDGNSEIYYKRSTDQGVSWGVDTRLTNNSAFSEFPSVSVSGSTVHVLWQDISDGNWEIYYKRSPDGGISWSADTRLTNNSANSKFPSVSVSGSVVHVLWEDNRDANYEIYYKRSTDAGISWGADTRLTNNSATSEFPSVSVSGSVVHVVWEDNRDANYEIYYKRSPDGGLSWGADTRLTSNSAFSYGPSVSESGSAAVHVIWYDNRDGNSEIYYKRSPDEGISWDAETRLTNNSETSDYPSLAISGSVVHVLWRDNRDGNFEIYYKRNPTGNPIGIINISSEIPNQFSLSQNYPNPFNPTTRIKFDITKESITKITVLDVLGREVSILVNESVEPGSYELEFNASGLSSGIYFYRIESGNFANIKKMMLIK